MFTYEYFGYLKMKGLWGPSIQKVIIILSRAGSGQIISERGGLMRAGSHGGLHARLHHGASFLRLKKKA